MAATGLWSGRATPYPGLNAVLEELVSAVAAILESDFAGAYLQGSFAVGDYDEHSDADFIIAIRKELAPGQVEALQKLHHRLYRLADPWAQHLEGSYVPVDSLGRLDQRGKPLWYLDHGSDTLIRSDHCNTLVVRWVLRERGIVLAGPEAESLIPPIPSEALRNEILATMRDWGREILDHPDRYRNRFYQSYIVFSYCRMLHDLIQGHPGSKREGAFWAQANLDPAWSGLIERAWAGRPDPSTAVRQPPDPADFESTLEFVRYALNRVPTLPANEEQ
jgi:Domain of unknown function (DUF4111)